MHVKIDTKYILELLQHGVETSSTVCWNLALLSPTLSDFSVATNNPSSSHQYFQQYTILERLDDVLSSLESVRRTESCRIDQDGSKVEDLYFKIPCDNKVVP